MKAVYQPTHIKTLSQEGDVYHFSFLNLPRSWNADTIDWNYSLYGKLWNYNLNYFDYLNEKDLTAESGTILIKNFSQQQKDLKHAFDPYPLSVRAINWIKFLTHHAIHEEVIDTSLYIQYQILKKRLEYHLLGNHLLENGFSLLLGGIYFDDKTFIESGKRIIQAQLKEQITQDGSHFELSPMYHQILLLHLLDCINFLKQNKAETEKDLISFLIPFAERMLGWLQAITFSNGDIPMTNDAAFFIAPSTQELIQYANSLKVQAKQISLKSSGYRKWVIHETEIFIDIANVKATYQAGHTHADTFHFILYKNELPLLVDTGVSTYENSMRRDVERSTMAHNTVALNNENSSEVWHAFRTGNRAKVTIEKETEDEIIAVHDGYKKLRVQHKRIFKRRGNIFTIDDIITGAAVTAYAYLHFHPGLEITIENQSITQQNLFIQLTGALRVEVFEYDFAGGFNNTTKAKGVKIFFENNLKTEFHL